ncbi:hypothetical protein DH86_00000556 [Scytalidium sp. 3C]|nr:hypothetical protein DH86_00000556 [Scytalidium sp. 3C]
MSHGVNESSLNLTDIEFLSPTPNSILLKQTADLHSPSIYTPKLDAFNASLYLVTNGTLASAPMISVPVPALHVRHPDTNITIETNATFISADQIAAFSTEGFNVTNAKVNLTAPAGQPNLNAFAYIPNPSVLTVEMGNVTMQLSTQLGVVGNSTINNMILKPGNNSLPLTGILDQLLVTKSLNATGWVTMSIVGQSAIYNGEHLPFYEKALASNTLTLDMNVLQILDDST